MSGDVYHEAKAQDIIALTSLPTLGDLYEPGCQRHVQDLQSVFQKPEPNMSQMLSMMNPLPIDAKYPKDFYVKDLEYLHAPFITFRGVLCGLSRDILLTPSLKAP